MKKEGTNESQLLFWVIVVTVTIIGLWIATYFLLKDYEPEVRGTLGDMFGTVNALFSGLALSGIIFTILLQRIELRYQRDELRETRKEFKIQNETLKLQRFENTFFNLLSLHHQIVESIDIEKITRTTQIISGKTEKSESRKTYTARDSFRYQYELMLRKITESPLHYQEVYLEHYDAVHTDLGHYFRNLYRMIKLVDESDLTNDDINPQELFTIKYKYTSIIRSQLSDYELLWLFYNCLSRVGNEKFKPLVEKYTLLKNIPQAKVASQTHLDLYNISAFQKQH